MGMRTAQTQAETCNSSSGTTADVLMRGRGPQLRVRGQAVKLGLVRALSGRLE